MLCFKGVGSDGEMFPEEAGLPMSKKFGGASYFLFQIHYNNPELHKNVIDQSGLRVFHTDNVRSFDMSFIGLSMNAMSPAMIIPPRQKLFKRIGYCPSECTRMVQKTNKNKTFNVNGM